MKRVSFKTNDFERQLNKRLATKKGPISKRKVSNGLNTLTNKDVRECADEVFILIRSKTK